MRWKHPPQRYTREMAALREAWGGQCVACGNKETLQFAHLKPTRLSGENGRGQPQRVQDIKKHPEAYVLLCEVCHRKLDSGKDLG